MANIRQRPGVQFLTITVAILLIYLSVDVNNALCILTNIELNI